MSLLGYGSGEIDQLGLGEDVMEAKKPRKVFPNELFSGIKIHSFTCGAMHTLVLSTMGKLYSWGCNDDFALGRTGADNEPALVELPCPINGMAGGDSHSIAYNTELNRVFLWGAYRNTDGKFGVLREKPEELNSRQWKGNIKKAVCGANHTMILSSRKLYLWGNSEFGQIGRMPLARHKNDAFKIESFSLNNVEDVFSGSNHSFLLYRNRNGVLSLRSWGLNSFFQLGHSNGENTWFPQEIEFFTGKEVKQATGGDSHSVVLLENGEVYVWGRNDENQLGFEDSKLVLQEPTKLDFFKPEENEDHKIDEILSSSNYTYVFNSKKQKVWSWGFGENYVLGNLQESGNEAKPFEISNSFYKDLKIKKISLGNQHVMVQLKEKTDSTEEEKDEEFEYDITPYLSAKNKRRKSSSASKASVEKKEKADTKSSKKVKKEMQAIQEEKNEDDEEIGTPEKEKEDNEKSNLNNNTSITVNTVITITAENTHTEDENGHNHHSQHKVTFKNGSQRKHHKEDNHENIQTSGRKESISKYSVKSKTSKASKISKNSKKLKE